MGNRAGYLRQNLTGECAYHSFVPAPLPIQPGLELDQRLWKQVVETRAHIAELETRSERIPDLDMFVSMYVRKEALMSSQIEGTQATLEDILDPLIETNTNADVADVVQYVAAVQYALDAMQKLPLCSRLLRDIHEVLLAGVRGHEKNPGEFRRSQNWIGGQGSTLQNARYIPPNVDDMREAMGNLEMYMNQEPEIDAVVSAALIHYQFETIHPFLDGNGRLGRLLIILYLMQQGVLSAPTLYVSYFLKQNRVEYYDRLSEVRRTGNYEQWVSFFLEALEEAARDAAETILALDALHSESEAAILAYNRGTTRNLEVLKYLEKSPIIDIRKTAEALKVSYPTVNSSVKDLVSLGVLKQTSNGRRNRTFTYEKYLDILKRGT